MTIPIGLIGAGVLAAHGIGHTLGWLPAWGLARFDQVSLRSWAVDPLLGQRLSESVAGALFLAPTLGFLAAAVALATGQPWWREAALISALASLLATVLYPAALPPSSVVGAATLNAAMVGLAIWGQPLLDQLARH
jgi:hypothetical protein